MLNYSKWPRSKSKQNETLQTHLLAQYHPKHSVHCDKDNELKMPHQPQSISVRGPHTCNRRTLIFSMSFYCAHVNHVNDSDISGENRRFNTAPRPKCTARTTANKHPCPAFRRRSLCPSFVDKNNSFLQGCASVILRMHFLVQLLLSNLLWEIKRISNLR